VGNFKLKDKPKTEKTIKIKSSNVGFSKRAKSGGFFLQSGKWG